MLLPLPLRWTAALLLLVALAPSSRGRQGPWEPIEGGAQQAPGAQEAPRSGSEPSAVDPAPGGGGADAELFVPRGGVLRIDVSGPLDNGLASQLRRARQLAVANEASLLLVLDTPGGEVELMRRLARQLDEADRQGVKTVAWVADRAHSAGALLALACAEIYTTPRGTIGSATPILVPGAFSPALPEAVEEKFSSAVRAEFRATAESRGRPGRIAEAMVDADVEVWELTRDGRTQYLGDAEYDDLLTEGLRPGEARRISPRGELLNLTAEEARRVGVSLGIARDVPELMEKLGRPRTTPVTVARTSAEEVAVVLDDLSILLLIAGLLFAYIELKVPGFGVPGVASIVCFALFLGGRWLVGLADWPQLVLITAGLALLVAELFFFAGTLWAGLLGGVCLFIGLLWSLVGPGLDLSRPMDRELLLDESFQLLVTALAVLVAVWILSRYLPRTPLLSRLVLVPAAAGAGGATAASALPVTDVAGQADAALVGAVGVASTELRPVGKIELAGRGTLEFEALASGGWLARGCRVRVVGAEVGRLVVEALPSTTLEPETSA